jgi:hypothetical protein
LHSPKILVLLYLTLPSYHRLGLFPPLILPLQSVANQAEDAANKLLHRLASLVIMDLTFSYELLKLDRNEIRVLDPLSGGFGDDIWCRLSYIDLLDYLCNNRMPLSTQDIETLQKESWEALSYAWGDPNVTSLIVVDGRMLGGNLCQAPIFGDVIKSSSRSLHFMCNVLEQGR